MLDWYQERVKESRSRLLKGSADSYISHQLLINYAAQRHDVSTLQRLKPSAQLWSQRWKHDSSTSLAGVNMGGVASLSDKIDGILFVLAAKQGHWHVMHKLATSRHPRKRWSPQMCLAMLRSRDALDMITHIQQGEAPLKTGLSMDEVNDTPERNDVVAKQVLWNMFMREFGHYIQRAKALSSNSKSSLPSWVTAALLELYSKSGKVDSTLDLARSYVQTQKSENRLSKLDGYHVLRNAPSRLLTSPSALIPGPRLLHSILKTFQVQENQKAVLQAFSALTLTHLDLHEEAPLGHPLFHQKEIVLEPDNTTILLAMDAIIKAESHTSDLPEKLLSFLRSVDRAWGSWRLRQDPSWHPMFLDLRPMQRLLSLCLETGAYRVVRQILRFQQGLLRRELKWHKSSNKKRIWRQGLNELTMLHKWADTLAVLRKRRWIMDNQAHYLYQMASKLARQYQYR